MEPEKDLVQEEKPKFFTRSAARHLRRKRLKNARRAEKELSELINDAKNDNDEQTSSATTGDSKIEDIQLKLLTIESRNLCKLPQPSSSLDISEIESKVHNQRDCHKRNNIEIEYTRSRTVDIGPEKHPSRLFRTSESPNGSADEISQTSNDKKEKRAKSPIINVTLKDNLLNAPQYSLPRVSGSNTCCNYDCKHLVITALDLNSVHIDDLMKNGKISKLNEPSDIVSYNNSIGVNIMLKNNEVETVADYFVNPTLSSNINGNNIVEKNDIQSNSFNSSNDENTTGSSHKTASPIKMADKKQNPLEKTREEIKAEREAKKAAKTAAKAMKMKIDKISETGNIKTKSPATENCERNLKIDDVTDTQNLQPTKEANLKESTVQSPTVTMQRSDACSEGKSIDKSKAELRAERRAKQEAQRAAKQQQQSFVKNNIPESKAIPIESRVENATSKDLDMKKNTKKIAQRKEDAHEINLFKHLYYGRELSAFNTTIVNSSIHPMIVKLGVRYANKTVVGSNARCVALLAAVRQVIQDFRKPTQADFIRGLEASLQESLTYLHHCRPLAVSMQNAVRYLKWQMTQFSSTLLDEDIKNKLKCMIDTYIKEQIELADKAISITIQSKISNGNIILTYGYSSLIHKILIEAHSAGKQFQVVVVDGRPWLEGKEQLRRLVKHGIKCSYILINALSFVMPKISKVFLGAHAILANGAVMSRVGSAQVALMANAFNVPVLVACETHKSCGRVQTDSIVYNELGDADELVVNSPQSNSSRNSTFLTNWRTRKSLNLLNITYDVTPADLVTAVVTELAILPCTSVPVILRIKPTTEGNDNYWTNCVR